MLSHMLNVCPLHTSCICQVGIWFCVKKKIMLQCTSDGFGCGTIFEFGFELRHTPGDDEVPPWIVLTVNRLTVLLLFVDCCAYMQVL